jgi:hypothetical protein
MWGAWMVQRRYYFLAFLVGVSAQARAAPSGPTVFEAKSASPTGEVKTYHCDEESWVSQPRVVAGVYIAELQMKCRIAGGLQPSVSGVKAAMEETLQQTRVVHEGPRTEERHGLKSNRYLVTVALKDEGEGIRVQEEVWIGSNESDRLLYETDSRQIQAQGMAAFLRKVWFRADVLRQAHVSDFEVTLSNRIEIARPWYAMEWVFVPIAKKSVLQKFHKVRNELLPKIAESLLHPRKGS